MPIWKIAVTGYPFIRGATPKGVCGPLAVRIDTWSPIDRPSDSASRWPMATPPA